MNYDILKDIVSLLEKYESSGKVSPKGASTEDFLLWAIQDQKRVPMNFQTLEIEQKELPQTGSIQSMGDQNARISQLITLLFKYVKFYFKRFIF